MPEFDPKTQALFEPLVVLRGVGEKLLPRFVRLINPFAKPARVIDLLLHAPVGVNVRQRVLSLGEAQPQSTIVIEVMVRAHEGYGRKGAPVRVLCDARGGELTLVFFGIPKERLKKNLPIGRTVVVSGKLDVYMGRYQMAHPDWIVEPKTAAARPLIEAVYPLTDGLSGYGLRKAMEEAKGRIKPLPEWHSPRALKLKPVPDFASALRDLHVLEGAQIDFESKARERLAFDELFATQVALQLVRSRFVENDGRSSVEHTDLRQKLLAALPYAPTSAQQKAFAEIAHDMGSNGRMLRLLQGDVGSGKTLVAAMAMCAALENNRQCVLMAPTEILARQHFETFQDYFAALGKTVILLTGSDKGLERKQKLAAIESGLAHIVLGTHALFQEKIKFADVGLAVVDEQHRFGVEQRLALAAKGPMADLLLMSATPIPRSLLLTAFGEMDVSVLDEKPPGRHKIDTRLIVLERLSEVIEGLKRKMADGSRIYWVCPLISETELSDLTAAEDRVTFLREYFGDDVALVHGKMKTAEKDAIIGKFVRGEVRILVATTVIEVGVNVPQASVMVIEQAERFGLAQLHQLRGRVGRGQDAATCLLLYRAPLGEMARARLEMMRTCDDGFKIAEEDLRLRGGGDLVGTQQSGLLQFRFADLSKHLQLLNLAKDEAASLIEQDGALTTPRGQAVRILLRIFGKDEAQHLLAAG